MIRTGLRECMHNYSIMYCDAMMLRVCEFLNFFTGYILCRKIVESALFHSHPAVFHNHDCKHIYDFLFSIFQFNHLCYFQNEL